MRYTAELCKTVSLNLPNRIFFRFEPRIEVVPHQQQEQRPQGGQLEEQGQYIPMSSILDLQGGVDDEEVAGAAPKIDAGPVPVRAPTTGSELMADIAAVPLLSELGKEAFDAEGGSGCAITTHPLGCNDDEALGGNEEASCSTQCSNDEAEAFRAAPAAEAEDAASDVGGGSGNARNAAFPDAAPSSQGSPHPDAAPSSQGFLFPDAAPSSLGSPQPDVAPSSHGSPYPDAAPSSLGSPQPDVAPSSHGSPYPDAAPSSHGSLFPDAAPSSQQCLFPDAAPSSHGSLLPDAAPSSQGSPRPDAAPSSHGSLLPDAAPSSSFAIGEAAPAVGGRTARDSSRTCP
jgi:hypothetical protein